MQEVEVLSSRKVCNQVANVANDLKDNTGASSLFVVMDREANETNIFENYEGDTSGLLETLATTIENVFRYRPVSPQDTAWFAGRIEDICSSYISGHMALIQAQGGQKHED